MERFQDQGKEYYKRKDYKKALEFFDRAVGRGQTVQLLDNRAACHEKLGDLQPALKDAKKTIQLQREDPTGYLRAGRILVKMGKHSVALEIYTHGLKSIKHVGQGYERLRVVQKALMDDLSPPKSVDPLTVLPRELVEYIFEYLSFKQRINACRVSKHWTGFIRSTPHLWHHLDLTGAQRKVKNAFISRAINTARKRLTTVTLTNAFDPEKALAALVAHCPLQEISLLDIGLWPNSMSTTLAKANSLKTLRIFKGTIISDSSLKTILKARAENLRTLEIESVGLSLPPLDIPCHALTSIAFTGLLHPGLKLIHYRELFPTLQSLKLVSSMPVPSETNGPWCIDLVSGFSTATEIDIEHMEIVNHRFYEGNLELTPALRVLRLRADYPIYGRIMVCDLRAPPATGVPPSNLALLEELALDIIGNDIELVASLLTEGSNANQNELPELGRDVPSPLRRLSLCNMSIEGFARVFDHPRLHDLRDLELRLVDLTDDHIAVVLTKCPELRSLDLSTSLVTGVAVRQIGRESKIGHLVLHDCRKLSIDAVDWARQQGVRVDYRMTDPSGGGRKVRH